MSKSTIFIQKTALFIFISLVMWGGINITYKKWVETDDAFIHQWEQFEKNQTIRAVILGDSHVAFGIDQSQLPDSVFNFAYPGDQWTDMLAKALHILNNRPEIKTFYIQIDEHNFFTSGVGERFRGDPRLFRYIDDQILKNIFDLTQQELWVRKIRSKLPLINSTDRSKFEAVLMKNMYSSITDTPWKPGFYYGEEGRMHWEYHQDDMSLLSKKQFKKRTQKKAFEMHRFDKNIIPLSIRSFKTLREILIKQEVSAHYFKMPVSKLYANYRSESYAKLTKMIQKPPRHQINFEAVYQDSLLYFADPSHLNSQGQARFTKYFKQQMLQKKQ